ncbi:MAG: enoyl-CoA hydratase/isomerase family protein [bacterium]|nr:enoyl-CoA hydratase/isomerase family protein [bacterium]
MTEHQPADYETIRYREEGHVAVVELARPKVLNAMNDLMRSELRSICESIRLRSDIFVMVIAGDDRAFSAGADISGDNETPADPMSFWRLNRPGSEFFSILSNVPQPTIAAISGYCLGGGLETALACDLRVASPDAQLGLTEARVGAIPAGGGTQRLARLVGPGVAAELLLTGRRISGQQALEVGLVNRLADDWLAGAFELANEILSCSPSATMLIKEVLWRGLDGTLETGLSTEFLAAALDSSAQDFTEGMTAFREKRPPRWKGR